MKHFMAMENRTYKINPVRELVEYAFQNIISPEQYYWSSAIQHVRKFQNEYWKMDQHILPKDQLIIDIAIDTDS